MAAARERLLNSSASMLATKQSLSHTLGTYVQQQYNPAEGTSGLLLQLGGRHPLRWRSCQHAQYAQDPHEASTVVSESTPAGDFPLLTRILPEMMKTTRFLAGLPLEKVILAKRCHYPQPRQPQTHPLTKATEGWHCASSRWAPSCSFAPNQQKSAGRLISLRFRS